MTGAMLRLSRQVPHYPRLWVLSLCLLSGVIKLFRRFPAMCSLILNPIFLPVSSMRSLMLCRCFAVSSLLKEICEQVSLLRHSSAVKRK
ncbi:hypothetical protein RB195_018871 [Necator americanus]|uniref:Bestrophin homolog n=1 Tax=Necator americanus TaxID=51031 RepID=A0ABR1CBL0_NECAM